MAITDPLIGDWIAANAPALAAIAPALGAAFVFFADPVAPAARVGALGLPLRPAVAPSPPKPVAAASPPPRPRPKLVAAGAASAKRSRPIGRRRNQNRESLKRESSAAVWRCRPRTVSR